MWDGEPEDPASDVVLAREQEGLKAGWYADSAVAGQQEGAVVMKSLRR